MPSNEHIPALVGGVILEIATTLWCGSWQTLPERRVYGELLTFDDPEVRLPAIDRLEGFRPGGPSLYRRVLVPVWVNKGLLLAWLFVAGQQLEGRIAPTEKICWQI